LLFLVLMTGCVPSSVPPAALSETASPDGDHAATRSTDTPGTATPYQTATPEDRWGSLFRRTPYPYTAPLPPASSSPLDGTYVKVDLSQAEHVHCLRCPDYLPEAGLWKLSLDHGIFRTYHEATGWRSLGSFTVTGNEMQVFNDPNCTDMRGAYKWQMDGDNLTLSVIEDECSIRLRAANLTKQPWLACRPPNREAMTTDHWAKPEGCD
jgi:hypothetical protein